MSVRLDSPRAALCVEAALLALLFGLHWASFAPSSVVHGPYELFAQDSVYILEYLEEGKRYRWNPQSHLLYHWVVEHGHMLWQRLLGPTASTFAYLKLFTALCGLAFHGLLLGLFRQLGLGLSRRLVLVVLSGVSVAAWFHFAAFETHALALPALVLYLIALVRLRGRSGGAVGPRVTLVVALLVCGLSRVDLFRLAAVSAIWVVLPSQRGRRFRMLGDLALVFVLGAVGNTWLASAYLDLPLAEGALAAYRRADHSSQRERLGQSGHLAWAPLEEMARAVSLYSFIQPLGPAPAGRGLWDAPIQEVRLEWNGKGPYPSSRLFLEPARNLRSTAISIAALAATCAVLALAGLRATRGALTGDALQIVLLAHAASGWIFYTWFNPYEPFLWIAEFLPLWLAMLAAGSRREGRSETLVLALAAAAIALHNACAFYLSFR